MSRCILLTGASGHLGQALLAQLSLSHPKCAVFVLPTDTHIDVKGACVFTGDIRKEADLVPFFEYAKSDETVVIHCAGIISITSKPHPSLYEVNVEGTGNLIRLCERYRVKKLIYVSSVHALPEKDDLILECDSFDPALVIGDYAKSKAMASQLIVEAIHRGLNANIVFPSGLCGPYDLGQGKMNSLILSYATNHLPCGIQGGYDFVDARDVAQGILTCVDKAPSGSHYILSNQTVSVQHILTRLFNTLNRRKIRLYLPYGVILPLSKLMERMDILLKRPVLFTPYACLTLQSKGRFSHDKATRDLDYHPRPFDLSLLDTIEWLDAQHRLP